MLQEQTAYQTMLPQLLAQYKNEFVAIYQGKVVDHDTNKIALVVRLDESYPDAVVLVQQVTDKPEKSAAYALSTLDRERLMQTYSHDYDSNHYTELTIDTRTEKQKYTG
ncbi:MAG: DUF5678 domain-containing protein [Chloroflexi bacterium]|nr:DUF5678 domain-containing protein [Chloroflexota bacterium]